MLLLADAPLLGDPDAGYDVQTVPDLPTALEEWPRVRPAVALVDARAVADAAIGQLATLRETAAVNGTRIVVVRTPDATDPDDLLVAMAEDYVIAHADDVQRLRAGVHGQLAIVAARAQHDARRRAIR